MAPSACLVILSGVKVCEKLFLNMRMLAGVVKLKIYLHVPTVSDQSVWSADSWWELGPSAFEDSCRSGTYVTYRRVSPEEALLPTSILVPCETMGPPTNHFAWDKVGLVCKCALIIVVQQRNTLNISNIRQRTSIKVCVRNRNDRRMQ